MVNLPQDLDTEIGNLLSRVEAGKDFVIEDSLKDLAFEYFNQQNQDDWKAFDDFFYKFNKFWTKKNKDFPFLILKDYFIVQNVFESLLELAYEWEHDNTPSKVHKGAPYYFYGVALIKYGNLEKGMLLMHQAANEDRRYNRTTSPALSFITLDYDNAEQFYKSKVLIIAQFLEDRLNKYRNTHGTSLDLELLRKKFLYKKTYLDEVFLFIYSIFKYFNLTHYIEKRNRENPLASFIETNLIFDLCKLCEILLRVRYPDPIQAGRREKPLVQKYHKFCEEKLEAPHIRQNDFQDVNDDFKLHFTNTLRKLLKNKYDFSSLTDDPKEIESDLALAYGLRNFSAHKVQDKRIIYKKFPDIVQSVLNTFFFIVEKKFPVKNR